MNNTIPHDANNSGLRLQKYLAENAAFSRRSAEEAILRGRISVNGETAVIGQKVMPGIDEVAVDGEIVASTVSSRKIYLMLNKPAGVVTTMNDEEGRSSVGDIVANEKLSGRVYPVGRLDMFSEGLLILTNDGEVANKLTHPKNHIAKVYALTIRGEVPSEKIKKLSDPIEIDGRMTVPAKVEVTEMRRDAPVGRRVTKLKIEIYEGRNRQIRRLCDEAELGIISLTRVKIGTLELGNLKTGQLRHLSEREINYLKLLK
ncbi:pseudouridine synthase [Clostridia bacterium]|nr:pseudouridine synthase [Clostridia bacterium]